MMQVANTTYNSHRSFLQNVNTINISSVCVAPHLTTVEIEHSIKSCKRFCLKKHLALYMIAKLFDNLDFIIAMCSFQFSLLSIRTHANVNIVDTYVNNCFTVILLFVNSMKLVLDTFSDNLLTANHTLNLSSSLHIILLNLTGLLPEQKAFVSSANSITFRQRYYRYH